MKAPEFRELRVADLRPSPHNPKRRTARENIKDLVLSIGRVGRALYPIVVSGEGVIIDGHRRAAAYRELGIDTIPAFIEKGDADAIYAEMNSTGRKMSGSEAMEVWLSNPKAVTHWQSQRFDRVEAMLGRRRMERFAKAGASLTLYNTAVSLADYCGLDVTPASVTLFADWLFKHRVTALARHMMAVRYDPRVIHRAVERDKPLAVRVAVKGDE